MARRLLTLVLLAVAANLLGLWAEFWALGPSGFFALQWSAPGLALVAYVVPGGILLRRARLPFRRFEESAKTGVLIGLYLLVTIPTFIISDRIRRQAFAELAERSAPLVTAIESFERDRGAPPASLDELVPEYLSAIPGTGIGAYPDYRYVTGDRASNRYGDRWALLVHCGGPGINFDEFWYVPGRAYPESRGGRVERIGDWAYLHE